MLRRIQHLGLAAGVVVAAMLVLFAAGCSSTKSTGARAVLADTEVDQLLVQQLSVLQQERELLVEKLTRQSGRTAGTATQGGQQELARQLELDQALFQQVCQRIDELATVRQQYGEGK